MIDSKDKLRLHEAKQTAIDNAALLQGHPLNTVLAYLELQLQNELSSCASHYDEVHVRRAQGSVIAYRELIALFKAQPVETRRSTSRQEV